MGKVLRPAPLVVSSSMAKKKRPPEFDPILPLALVPGSELPEVKAGEGEDYLRRDTPTVTVELPYNAFFLMWEWAEARAASEYTRYLGFLPHVSQARLATVVACRNAALAQIDQPPLKVYSEEKATKARRINAKLKAAEEAANREKMAKARAAKKSKGSETAPEASESAAPTRKSEERPRKRTKAQKSARQAKKGRQKNRRRS